MTSPSNLTTITVQPNSCPQQGLWTYSGAASPWQAVSSGVNTSYVELSSGLCKLDNQVIRFGFPAITIPTGAQVYSVAVRREIQCVVPPFHYPAGIPLCLHWFRSLVGEILIAGQQPMVYKTAFSSPCPTSPSSSTWTIESLYTAAVGPDGAAWSTAVGQNLATGNFFYDMGRGDIYLNAAIFVSEVWLDVTYQQLSSVAVTAPTGTNDATNATVQWTYTSADSQPQQGYQVAIYTQAQTAAVGFTPFVTTPLDGTGGFVLGQELQWSSSYDLSNGSYAAYCVDMDTEILTHAGWKEFGEVSVDDLALTLNHETGLSEWQPITHLHYFPPQEREMLRMEGRGHSSLTTRDHRWPTVSGRGLRKWKTSESLKANDGVTLSAPCSSLPVEPKYQDAFVELVAWVWTEGHLISGSGGKPCGLTITQSHVVNEPHCVSIRRTLTEMYGEAFAGDMRSIRSRDFHSVNRPAKEPRPAWREDRTHRTVFSLNRAAAEAIRGVMDEKKRVSFEFLNSLTHAQLKLFMDTSIDGDGHRGKDFTVLIQKDLESVRRLEMACALIGVATNTIRRASDGCYQLIFKKDTRIRPISNAERPGQFVAEWVTHEGAVWCPTTQNGSWLARRRGTVYYTGNCQVESQWSGPGEFLSSVGSTTWTRSASGPPANANLTAAFFDNENNRVSLSFSPGGSSPATTLFTVYASRNGGASWAAIPSLSGIPAEGMSSITGYDYVAPINVASQYQVIAFGGTPLQSAGSPSQTLSVTPVGNQAYLKSPTNPLLNTVLPLAAAKDSETGIKSTLRRLQGTFQLLGGAGEEVLPFIVSGPTYGREYQLELMFIEGDETLPMTLYAAVDALDNSGETLLLQFADGTQLWGVTGPGASGQETEETFGTVSGDPTIILWRRRKIVFTETNPPSYY